MDATDSQSAIVNSPNVTMKITDRSGSNIVSAQVGDPLMIRFEIADATSEFNSDPGHRDWLTHLATVEHTFYCVFAP